jgi:tetratricopeptide (TPR) repeat protein
VLDLRCENYLAAICHERMGKLDEAKALYEAVLSHSKEHMREWGAADTLSALTLIKMGRKEEADDLMEQWIGQRPDITIARWCYAAYHKDHTKALAIIKDKKSYREDTSFFEGSIFGPQVDPDFKVVRKILELGW